MGDPTGGGAEVREVLEEERDGRAARVVVLSRGYDEPVGEVWAALTEAGHLERWFLPVEGELEPGGRYRFEGNAEGTITRCERPAAIDATWEYAGNVSWVEVRLEPAKGNEDDGPGRVRLTLRHAMPKDEAGEAHWGEYGPGATGVGWDLALRALGRYLARPEDFDRATEEAWPTTEPGKAWARRSAAAWGEADAAAGGDATAARERAERVAGFYTAE